MKHIKNLHRLAMRKWYQWFFAQYRQLCSKVKRENYRRWAVFTVVE